ncbi:hypothetical protein DICPUDRAFT_84371 [Dictyostelium purpureum]|uniref:Cytochrome P450 family protein n=1 Tax=Dictyostelium purpureum TaxID=5786 RepID=F1A2G2_DICPU|nr:uncharacterized protein DICPUDRAFT_84371 [Dictyostelium purpureum]EGC29624.1 hypothetical protein DICPUDRAFT_84371 [Dictyostelium purpureum]|eukprot:XP_003293857.1 hypothetical protein DICPUDRAFT_84371 [Dictyostelium purpureum]
MNFLLLITFLLLFFLILDFIKKNKIIKSNSPPGPINYPLIGNLHLLGSNPHRGLRNNISDKYGPIVGCYLGDKYTIILSDSKFVNEIYIKKFRKFCSRPHNPTFTMFSGGYKDLAFSDNFDDWRRIRSLIGVHFTKSRLNNTIYSYIEDQTKLLIKSMKQFEINSTPFFPQKYYFKLSLNVICKLFFSVEVLPKETVDKSQIERLSVPLQKISRKLGAGHPDDFISLLSPLFYFSKKNYEKHVHSCLSFISEIYDSHLTNLDRENPRDLMDILIIETEGDRKEVVHTAFNFLLGGSDSSSGTKEFFSLYMINYPDIQEKAYKEIIDVMGNDCKFIGYKDKTNLPFLSACVNEVLRLNPEDPLGLPRKAVEDIEIFGYFIPKGAQIIHNIYAVGTNPDVFTDRDKFKPERWVDCSDVKKALMLNSFMPFSIGQRSCIGKNLSEIDIFVGCANLLLNYKMEPYEGIKLNEVEEFGVTIHPKEYSIKLTSRKKFN